MTIRKSYGARDLSTGKRMSTVPATQRSTFGDGNIRLFKTGKKMLDDLQQNDRDSGYRTDDKVQFGIYGL